MLKELFKIIFCCPLALQHDIMLLANNGGTLSILPKIKIKIKINPLVRFKPQDKPHNKFLISFY